MDERLLMHPRAYSWFRPLRIAVGALLLIACGAESSGVAGDSVVNVTEDAVTALAALDDVARVVDVQPTDDGRVWVLNSVEPFFIVLTRDGRVERQFGERGGGPEEFNRPVALLRGPDPAEVWTYDWSQHALILLSASQRRELVLRRDSLPIPSLITFKGAGINPAAPWLESTRDGFLLARARAPQYESALHLWSPDILLIRDDGQDVSGQVHMPLADELGDPEARYPGAKLLLPYPLWAACADRTIVLYDPLANTVRRFTEELEELAPLALPDERRLTMTPDLVFDLFYRQLAEDVPSDQIPGKEQMRQLTADQNAQFVLDSSEFFPEYTDLRCADDGMVWLRPFDVNRGRLGHGPNWLRVSQNGSRTLFILPEAFRTFKIEGGRLWGTIRDHLDVESIAWIELN